jgi:hypothetical protein
MVALAAALVACGRGGKSTDDAAPPAPVRKLANTSPNDFFGRGAPTFVRGTKGDERADRGVAAQVELIRSIAFDGATVVDDYSIDTAEGGSAWPHNAVVYGAGHVNELLASLAPTFPFRIEPGALTLGDELFRGDEYRLIAVVPTREADERGPGYPEFLLYAGTGTPGVAEINGVRHGASPILVADTFGPLVTGQWKETSDGVMPELDSSRASRIRWRAVERTVKSSDGKNTADVRISFPQKIPAADDEEQVIDACLRGLRTAIRKLAITHPASVSIYVYPDVGSKRSLTGDAGHGHAVVSSRALHVLRFDPSPGGGLESLLAHEATHVLAHESWGPAGSSLLGEGLAVWVSGQYGGTPLADWQRRIETPPRVADLLGKAFRQLPERETYPVAGLLVAAAVQRVGLANVRDHLFGASAETWAAACASAGSSPRELQQALHGE